MPIYEYQCTQCGEKFEVRQSIGEDGSKLNCPSVKRVTRKGLSPLSLVVAREGARYRGQGAPALPEQFESRRQFDVLGRMLT